MSYSHLTTRQCYRRQLATAIRRALIAISIVCSLIGSLTFVSAKQTVLPVTPGWDVFDAGTGYVIYSVTNSRRACRPKLQITYILQGAKPGQSYDLAVGIFNLPGDGLKFFGVPRLLRNTFTREGVTAIHDGFLVGKFTTDRLGNGEAHVELDLAGVPAGSYSAQFTWTRRSDLRGYYRTGTKYGEGFGTIVVP